MGERRGDSGHRYGGRRVGELRAYVWATMPHVCWLCGKGIGSFAEFEVDHVLPRSMGGSDDPANLRPAHGRLARVSCNQRRGARVAPARAAVRDDTAWFASRDADGLG